ncbi:hypothetical protein SAMN06295987_1221, partial [Novosphingobium mathurense]
GFELVFAAERLKQLLANATVFPDALGQIEIAMTACCLLDDVHCDVFMIIFRFCQENAAKTNHMFSVHLKQIRAMRHGLLRLSEPMFCMRSNPL